MSELLENPYMRRLILKPIAAIIVLPIIYLVETALEKRKKHK